MRSPPTSITRRLMKHRDSGAPIDISLAVLPFEQEAIAHRAHDFFARRNFAQRPRTIRTSSSRARSRTPPRRSAWQIR